MIVLPVLGALAQIFIPQKPTFEGILKGLAISTSLLASFCGIILVFFGSQEWLGGGHFSIAWIASYQISYDVAVDGLNSLVVLLVSVVFPIVILADWETKKGTRGIYGLLLLLQTSLFGLCCSQDLFLIFFFMALSTVPIYFLTAIWGGEKKEQAAFRFLITASLGNALFFAVLVLIYYSSQPHTFSLRDLLGGMVYQGSTLTVSGYEFRVSSLTFFIFCAAMALRIPIWPLHGWFSFLTTQAKTNVLVVFCGVILPVYFYIFYRLGYSLFPEQFLIYSPTIMIIGGINVLIGAFIAISQKKLGLTLAYLTITQMGFVLMGVGSLESVGVVGAVYQTLAAGLALAGFGLFAGMVVERTGHSEIQDKENSPLLGGAINQAPLMALVVGVVILSLIGMPAMGGFIGKSLIIMGGFAVHPLVIVVLAFGLIILTYGLFSFFRSVFLGEQPAGLKFNDLSIRERGYLIPLTGSLMVLGIYPKPLLDLVKPSVVALLSLVK